MDEVTQGPSIRVDGPDEIEGARWLTVRSALKLEIGGMKRSRPPSARVLANQITGRHHANARAAYTALDERITEVFGPDFAKPLDPPTP